MTMNSNWRDFFVRAQRMSWQAVELRPDQVMPTDRVNSTEAMYQAFKARLLEETGLTNGN